MKFGSVCSGVEAASVAWESLGWEAQWLCEFDAFPSAVLAHHYPNVPNLHDMTTIEEKDEYNDRPIELLVGGTPCQSFSIAGLRKGLDDDRGNLALKYCEILAHKQPRWFVWENVPGVLSSNEGADLASIFAGFRECGYQFAYRVLDAQHFGVPQRRRRIFVVGYLGDWRPPAAVLFEPESLCGDLTPSREERERASARAEVSLASGKQQTGTLLANAETKQFLGNQEAFSGDYYIINGNIVDRTEKSGGNGLGVTNDGTVPTLRTSDNHVVVQAFNKRPQELSVQEELAYTLRATDYKDGQAVCFEPRSPDGVPRISGDIVPTLNTMSGGQREPHIYQQTEIRRLTPLECERLQGFPDNWTKIPWRNKPASQCPDGPRYKCMGNSMAVPVMHWIGKRIQMWEDYNG